MLPIADLRRDLAAALAAATGLPVTGYVPERLNPPLVYCREADPFIAPAEDSPFGTWQIRFDVDVIEAVSTSNAAMVAAADKHAAQLLDLAGTYGIEIGAYATAAHAGQTYLVVPATITTTHR